MISGFSPRVSGVLGPEVWGDSTPGFLCGLHAGIDHELLLPFGHVREDGKGYRPPRELLCGRKVRA
jgi:hypothetical protein